MCVLTANMCFDRGQLSLDRRLQSLAKILPRFPFLFFCAFVVLKAKAKHPMPVFVLPANMCFDRGQLSFGRSVQSLAKMLPRFPFRFFVRLWCSRGAQEIMANIWLTFSSMLGASLLHSTT